MSGGVDSAVAAALLQEQGYEVIGVTMRLYGVGGESDSGRGCCGDNGVREAQRNAARLGIPHYAWDLRSEFEQEVVEDFCREYARGRTPNPCLRCNSILKFRLLLERARTVGAERLATGHYARIDPDGAERWRLRRGSDTQKDQSYFLYQMTQQQLACVLMPLGGMTKSETRERARALGLPAAEKNESQEVCFIPDDDLTAFLRVRQPELFQPGPVLDTAGRVIGEHRGLAAFTIGQRKRLGVAAGERRYVVKLDRERNAVVVGPEPELLHRVVVASHLTWVRERPQAGRFTVWAKVRSQGLGSPAEVELLPDGCARVLLEEPQWAPAPGQAVVFWDGDEVLGGGTIERSAKE